MGGGPVATDNFKRGGFLKRASESQLDQVWFWDGILKTGGV